MFLVVLASFGTLALGQDWPKPPKTPRTEGLCNTSGCVDANEGMKIIGYSAPITTFVGRYVDTTSVGVDFNTFHTVRAKEMRFAPDRNRIYTMLGSALAAYDIDSFFTRLESGEVMASIRDVTTLKDRPNRKDAFLYWDRYFYFKNGAAGTNYTYPDLNAGDGENKLFDYDWDDRGYLYMANGPYSWGITKDDGGVGRLNDRLKTVFQRTGRKVGIEPEKDVPDPNVIVSVKVGSNYYIVVLDHEAGGELTSVVNVWNVTDPAAPKHVKSALFEGKAGTGFRLHKRTTDGSRIAVLGKQKKVHIYTGQGLIDIGTPLVTFADEDYLSLTTDGTNFYATSIDGSSGAVHLSIFSPSGNTYTKTKHVLGVKSPAGNSGALNYGAGYLTYGTYERERSLNGSYNVWLLKLNGLAKPLEINLGSWVNGESSDYVAKYYGKAIPAGYVGPGNWADLKGAHVHKKGSKYYLIIEAFGIADVYEIKGSDSIDAKVKKVGKKVNENSKAPVNSGPFYGDDITFTSDFSGSVAPPVNWDFGDGVLKTALASSPDISHQYGGLVASDLPKSRTVKATNANDSSQIDTLSVTLAKPQVRVGLAGTTTLFTQSTVDYTLPIVSSDLFTDASDGAVEGHYSEWNIDSVVTKREPNLKQSVGPIGKRTLIFSGHYGPYDVAGATITPGSSAASFTINSIKYEVRPFAAAINGPLSCTGQNCGTAVGGDGVGFRSATRVTTTAADLTGLTGALVKYKWQLLKPGTGGLVDAGYTLEGEKAFSQIPDFVIPRTAFQNAVDWKARLTLTLVTTAAVTDPQYAVSTAESVPLLGPTTNTINRTGCENVGAPCTFNTPSTRADVDPATWTYFWEVLSKPTAAPALPTAVTATYSPKFTVMGSYTVRVKVSNAIGDATLTTTAFTVGAPICSSAPTDSTTTITYRGATSGCAAGSNCSVNENIAFIAQPYQWIPADCDKYEWDFGDGTAKSTEKEPTHAYNRTGTFEVILKIDGGISDATVKRNVVVGNSVPDDPDDPPPTGCATMSANGNVFISMKGSVTQCDMNNPNCSTEDTVTFTANQFNYNYSCASHTFTWNFNDGTPTQSGKVVEHKFASAGTYNVTVRIRNNKQDVTVPGTKAVKVSGGGTDQTTCPNMIANGNVYIALTGTVSGCNAVTGNCSPTENINFRAATLSYSYGCAPHTFEWSFGDNSTSTQQDPVHAYATPGPYKVSLKITRSGQSVTMEQNLTIKAPTPTCEKMHPEFNIFTTFVGAKTRCTSSGGNCEEGEEIAFNVTAFQYLFTCAPHSFLWDFGDGSPAVGGQSPMHTYTRPGTFAVKVKVSNTLEEVILNDSVTILPDGPSRRRIVRH